MGLQLSPVIAGGGGSGGASAVTSTATITDNAIVRGDGGVRGIQESPHIILDNGNTTFTQSVITTGSPTFITFTGGAHTTLTSGEATDIDFNLARTVQFATGNFALQRAFRIQAPTYAAVGASTIDKAVTLSIGPPVAGANMTLTDRYALRLTGSLEMAPASGPAVIQVTSSDLGLSIRGNRASSGLSAQLYVTSATTTSPLVRLLTLAEADVEKFNVFAHGGVEIVQSSESTADVKLFTATPGTYTGQTAATEIQNFSIATYTRTWNAGATITNQREIVFNAPTYAFGGASTITNAATLYVSAAPIAGANATITNSYALWTDSGNVRFDGNVQISQEVATTGSPTMFTAAAAAHTTLTSAEMTDVNFNLSRTVQFATGNITTERAFRIQAPTWAFVGASIITNGITLDVDKPTAGTNATITNIRAIRSGGILEINNGSISTHLILSGGTSNIVDIEATGTNMGIRLLGNLSAGTSTATLADVNVVPNAVRTAGNVFRVSNNSQNRFSVNYQGTATACETATTGGTARSFIAANPNHTGQTAGTEINNWLSSAYTRTWASNSSIATQREFYIAQPTYAFATAGGVITDAATLAIGGAPVAGTNASIARSMSLWVQAGSAHFDGRVLTAQGADVAAANDLTLGADGNTFEITGATQINAITTSGWLLGSMITLLFASTPTVKHNTAGGAGTAVILLAGAADFSATAGDTLTLRYSDIGGTSAWREMSRAAI